MRRLCFYKCLFVHGGDGIPPGQTPPPTWVGTPRADPAPMVNERAVRILLECILVFDMNLSPFYANIQLETSSETQNFSLMFGVNECESCGEITNNV